MSFPSQDQEAGHELGLENRLRGMILSNASPVPEIGQQPPVYSPPTLPPHMMAAHPAAQQEYLARQHNLPTPPTVPVGQGSPGGRKRMNQAQRRQMNNQLSIPIDSRPNPSGLQSGRGGFNSQHRNNQHYNGAPNAPFPQGSQQKYSPPFHNGPASAPFPPPNQYQQYSPQEPLNMQALSQMYQGQPRQQYVPAPTGSNFNRNQHQNKIQPTQGQRGGRNPMQQRQLYNPNGPSASRNAPFINSDQLSAQTTFLEDLVRERVPNVAIDGAEIAEKEAFRAKVEQACRDAIAEHEQGSLGGQQFPSASVELKCFGSMASGFATKASDMDLAILSPLSIPSLDSSESAIPRILERKLLDMGFGARLLTRTRVPIIKLCQEPSLKLRMDLIESRSQWENGFVVEEGVEEDDIEDEEIHAAVEMNSKSDPKSDSKAAQNPPKSASLPKPPATRVERLASFKQKPKDSLGDYYGCTKRLLKKLGGHDLMTGLAPDTTQDVLDVLGDVCMAFVSGLHDEELKMRLRFYQSLDSEIERSRTTVRSLAGIYSQMEGEKLIMAWDKRTTGDMTENLEKDILRQIDDWKKLCNMTSIETGLYNRQLHQSLDRLKTCTLLQLVSLEQGPAEDPGQYSSRTIRIMKNLSGNAASVAYVAKSVTLQYVEGVQDSTIKSQLQTMYHGSESVQDFPSLQAVTDRHRVLDMAKAYTNALKAEIFSEEDSPTVQGYIELLTTASGQHVAHDSATSALLSKISLLPDPTKHRKHRSGDRYHDALEFPKSGIGIQCDINFSAQLALHNTLLLRCYSLTDSRVIPLILFVKHWAKVRGINSPYRGTLSSYGYVLMVLHYLINVANPFVCPNLQLLKRDPPAYLSPTERQAQSTCLNKDVRFWRNEREINDLAQRGLLNHNKDSMGLLLRGFFEYYAQAGLMSTGNGRGFEWGREVLSLRTEGGILSKQMKGWVGAKTVTETTVEAAPAARRGSTDPSSGPVSPDAPGSSTNTVPIEDTNLTSPGPTPKTPTQPKSKIETKEIRHRYLFAIEDPFELDHNVARTVTHNGIVSIRDEFRRAWRMIKEVGRRASHTGAQIKQESLLDEVVSDEWKVPTLRENLVAIHGEWEMPKGGVDRAVAV